MKHLSVRVAVIFIAISLGIVAVGSTFLYVTYRKAVVNDKYDDVVAVYAETVRLLREQSAGHLTPAEVEAGVDVISRVGLCKIYVIRYDPASLEFTLPSDLVVQTQELIGDLGTIAGGKTVFREMVFRNGGENPFVFFGGPAPTDIDAAAILIFTSAGLMYNEVREAANRIALDAVCLILIIAVIVIFTADRLMRPLRQMTASARRLADGEVTLDIPVPYQDEIGELTRTFNYMKTRVADNENARQEFLASMSHDIRTPLTHIRASALGLQEGWIPPDMREKAMSLIVDESARLIAMTNDLLEAARIQSGTVELRLSVVELHSMLREAADASPHPDQALLVCDPGLKANVDENLFRRVLANLLDNAFRYGKPPVEIHGFATKGGCSITIRDHGAGLPEADLERIFERFYRAKTTAQNHKGMGIGLHSARRALQLHGGEITARSAEGGGLEFTLTWPDSLNAMT